MGGIEGSLWTSWHGHVEVLVGIGLLLGVYLLSVGPLRARYAPSDHTEPGRIALFILGVLVIFVSVLSPIHELSDRYLFSAHMLQHLLLTLVAPPLLILGTPGWMFRPLIQRNMIFRLARLITRPVPAFFMFNATFSIWHIPALYNLSVISHEVHIGEHLLFIATAMIMWWPLTSNVPELPRLSYPLAIIYLFLLSIAQIIVFAPITFSREPLYEWYVDAPRIFGLSPLTDQQLGGIIMKIGGAAIFLPLLIVLFFRWYSREEDENRIDEVMFEARHSYHMEKKG